MNVAAADPHWYGWIISYFFLGGIAAGSYFLATLAELFGSESDRRIARGGYWLAAPLIALCGILLIADLSQPARFWHMLFDHATWRPHIKIWSPMSIGAWAVLLFSLVSTASWLGVLSESGWLRLGWLQRLATRLHRGILGRAWDVTGIACGFFLASYTGVLLTATNQPVWSQSPWIGPLFLASAAGTGLAAVRLLHVWTTRGNGSLDGAGTSTVADRGPAGDSREQNSALDAIEPAIWGLEIVTAFLFLLTLGWPTLVVLARDSKLVSCFGGALGLGVLVPMLLHARRSTWKWAASLAACSVLLGGFMLRYAVLTAPRSVRSAANSAHAIHVFEPRSHPVGQRHEVR